MTRHSGFTQAIFAGLVVLLNQGLAFAGPPPSFTRTNVGKSFPADARGNRVALGDVDSDGDPDLLLNGRLFLNDGKGKFSRARRRANLWRGALAAIFLDYDRDGDLDVFTSGHGNQPDRLFRNDTKPGGPVLFRDVSGQVGANLNDGSPGEGLGAGDLNGDGFPDIYVANYEVAGRGTRDRLYLSDGKGGFTDASHMASSAHIGRGVSMADFDRDGDLDIFVSNYRLQPNLLWVNNLRQTGAFSTSNLGYPRGVAGTPRGGGWGHTIGSAWGDLDGDGDLDLVSANLAHPGAYLRFSNMTQVMLQNPNHTFTTREAGRDATLGIKYEESHSNPTLFDADNDGDLDLHFTSIYDDSFLYRNRSVEDGKLSFRDVTTASKTRTFVSWGAATADVNGDGRLDLIVCAADNKPVLFTNTTPKRFKSVRIRLRGRASDKWGIGATAQLRGGGAPTQVRQLMGAHGTSSQSEPILHFGVGKAKGPHKVRVEWPSGAVSERAVMPGKTYTMFEPKRGTYPRWQPAPVPTTPTTTPSTPTYPGP